jgi:hypothetical protein
LLKKAHLSDIIIKVRHVHFFRQEPDRPTKPYKMSMFLYCKLPAYRTYMLIPLAAFETPHGVNMPLLEWVFQQSPHGCPLLDFFLAGTGACPYNTRQCFQWADDVVEVEKACAGQSA